jgi:hypothetical protein
LSVLSALSALSAPVSTVSTVSTRKHCQHCQVTTERIGRGVTEGSGIVGSESTRYRSEQEAVGARAPDIGQSRRLWGTRSRRMWEREHQTRETRHKSVFHPHSAGEQLVLQRWHCRLHRAARCRVVS